MAGSAKIGYLNQICKTSWDFHCKNLAPHSFLSFGPFLEGKSSTRGPTYLKLIEWHCQNAFLNWFFLALGGYMYLKAVLIREVPFLIFGSPKPPKSQSSNCSTPIYETWSWTLVRSFGGLATRFLILNQVAPVVRVGRGRLQPVWQMGGSRRPPTGGWAMPIANSHPYTGQLQW